MSRNSGFEWNKSPAASGRHGQQNRGRRGYNTMPRSPSETLEPMRAAEPPMIQRKKREYHHTLVFMSGTLTTLVLLLIGISVAIGFAKYIYDARGPLKHSDIIVIPKGEGVSAIADRLERRNMILDKRLFKAAVMYFGVQNKLKAGEYEIPKQASMRQVLDHLLEGKSIMHSLPFPEGLTSQQLVERLNAHPTLTGEVLEIPAEGSILPDTYRFVRGTDRQDLIQRMQSAQNRFIDSLWDQRSPDLPIKTKQDALILASIVEKETGVAGERAHIAGVFVNRLRKGMRLQSDPTIIYGLVGGVGKLGRGIRRSEIKQPTPYNTYQIDGLPPTPIANPGRAAIEAVLNPKPTKDLYFVADGTGGHVFSKTLREHENNVRKWRKIERQRKQDAVKAAQEKEKQEALPPQDNPINKDSNTDDGDKQSNNDIFDNLKVADQGGVALSVKADPAKQIAEKKEILQPTEQVQQEFAKVPLPLKK